MPAAKYKHMSEEERVLISFRRFSTSANENAVSLTGSRHRSGVKNGSKRYGNGDLRNVVDATRFLHEQSGENDLDRHSDIDAYADDTLHLHSRFKKKKAKRTS